MIGLHITAGLSITPPPQLYSGVFELDEVSKQMLDRKMQLRGLVNPSTRVSILIEAAMLGQKLKPVGISIVFNEANFRVYESARRANPTIDGRVCWPTADSELLS